MLRSLALLSILGTFAAANAQSAGQADSQAAAASQPPAPIVRSYPSGNAAHHWPLQQQNQVAPQITESQPVVGVWLRSDSTSALSTVSATPQRSEFRLDRGRLNVTVHHPADHAEILVDLPGGQTSLLKDGLYTFNADTTTVRVLRGEAAAWPGAIAANANTRPIKIKEDHQLGFVAANGPRSGEVKAVECFPYEIAADLLPRGYAGDYAEGGYAEDYPPYGPYPYYAGLWGYPYAYPGFYPGFYGFGYPVALGIGFGYYGGFHGGYGFRGGFHR